MIVAATSCASDDATVPSGRLDPAAARFSGCVVAMMYSAFLVTYAANLDRISCSAVCGDAAPLRKGAQQASNLRPEQQGQTEASASQGGVGVVPFSVVEDFFFLAALPKPLGAAAAETDFAERGGFSRRRRRSEGGEVASRCR